MSSLSLAFLGPFWAEFNGKSLTHFRTKTVQALLIYLTCQPEAHSREKLMTMLWPGMPQVSAQKNLRQSLYLLRQAIPEIEAKSGQGTVPLLLADRKTVQMNPNGRYTLDLHEFNHLLKKSEPQWRKAVALYRGDFLADFYLPDSAPFETWADARRAEIRRQVLTALEMLTDEEMSHGQLDQAKQYARSQIAIDNLRERAYQQLMEILARESRRVDALSQYETLAKLLQTELGVNPSAETQALMKAIRTGEFAKITTAPTPQKQDDKVTVIQSSSHLITEPPLHNLPAQPTPLIGREAELADLDKLLMNPEVRLISIVGPGGMGKTRLAIACAERQVNRYKTAGGNKIYQFPDGVFMVKLAAVANAKHIAPTLAQTLSLQLQGSESTEQQILNYLREKKLLLLIDNFEHLLGGVRFISDILSSAPDVYLLVTSRERLKLQVEQLYPIPGLVYREWHSLTEANKDGAARLFSTSARRILPDFVFKEEHLEPVWHICRLVQGMPLGIVLAAAWVELLSPKEIAAELSTNLDLLEADYADLPKRQRSIRIVFRATWGQLSSTEQTVFRQLSFFRGGFSVEAARIVTDASLRILMKLVDKTLLISAGNGRFEVHELIRQFAAEELLQLPEEQAATKRRHAIYYCQRMHTLERALKGVDKELALSEIAADIENIQQAWNWAVENEQFSLLRQAIFSLATFCMLNSRLKEGLNLIDSALIKVTGHITSQSEVDPDELLLQVRLLAWKCAFLFKLGSTNAAEEQGLLARNILDKSPLLKGTDSRYERALVLVRLGRLYEWLNRHEETIACLEESQTLFNELGEQWGIARCTFLMGGVALRRGEYDLAIDRFGEAERQYKALGNKREAAYAQYFVGALKVWVGHFSEGERLIKQSLKVFQEVGDPNMEGWALTGLGDLALMSGQFEEACLIYTKSASLRTSLGMKDHAAIANVYWCWATTLQGKYHLAQDKLGTNLDILRRSENKISIGLCLLIDGSVNLVLGNIAVSQQCLGEGVQILRSAAQRDELSWTLAVFSCTLTNHGELEQAQKSLTEALQLAQDIRSICSILYTLAAAALFFTKKGMVIRAIEVFSCANQNPFVANSKWFQDVVENEVEALKANLPTDVAETTVARGQEMDLWETAEALLAELQEEDTH